MLGEFRILYLETFERGMGNNLEREKSTSKRDLNI